MSNRHGKRGRLRKGDILTHCFRPFPNAPAHPGGGVRPEVLAARERGFFDGEIVAVGMEHAPSLRNYVQRQTYTVIEAPEGAPIQKLR